MSPDYNHLHLTIKSKLAAYHQNMPDKRPKSLSPAFLNQPNQTRQTQPTRLLNNQTKDNATKQQNKTNAPKQQNKTNATKQQNKTNAPKQCSQHTQYSQYTQHIITDTYSKQLTKYKTNNQIP
jgi:hypothetical protein